MRIAVLGSRGQLGRDLCSRLRSEAEIFELTRAEIDLERPESIAPYLTGHKPDVFVNCAAYNLVDKAETEPEAAFRVNAFGVREAAKACSAVNCTMVHFSTDYVYGLEEQSREPLREADAPGPVSAYGASKLAGEYFVRMASPNHLVIRTCGLYGVWGSGGKGGNFVETMLRVAGQGKPLRVVDDQRCTPTYTTDLAAAVVEMIRKRMQGLYHVTSSGSCTWHEFAAEIFRQAGVAADLAPTTSAAFGAPARRPGYSVLSSEKLAAAGVKPLRSWQEALGSYLQERINRKT